MSRLCSVIVVIGLIAVACNGEGGESTTTATADATTTTGPLTTTTMPPRSATTTAAPAAGDTSGCVVGTWVLDSEAFVGEMAEIFGDAGMADAEITPLGGDFTVEFAADGTLSAVREEWGFEIGAAESTFRVEVNGSETGTWSAEGSTLTVNTDVSDLIANSSIVVDGEELPMPPGLETPGIPDTIASESDYTCEGDVLTISNEGVTSTFDRA